jgi:LuxR family transcriptional regulator, maltose regulon positive regulatory protein
MRFPSAPLVLLVAPAGYGKTVLLSEWAAHDERPFAWVELRDDDNEPALLLEHVAGALDPVAPGGGDALDRLSEAAPLVVVLDDAQVLHEPAALTAVAAIRQVLPAGSQLALASRSQPALPLGRLRAHGNVVELGTRDLAMSATEAGALLTAQGVELESGDVSALAVRTEGWPAGLYLAALSLRGQPNLHAAVQRFSGDGRYVAEFLRDELLSGLSEEQVRFVLRSSVLDRLSGPLCDAVLHTRGSATTLAELSRSNLLLVPLDGGDHWYRYHTLLGEMLRSELRRLEPELEAQLHSRACTWHADHGDSERAIEHAVGSRDVRRAGELMWRAVSAYTGGGRNSVLRRWLGRFTAAEIASCPRLALVAAQSHLADGEGDRAEHWTAVAREGFAGLTVREGRKPVEAGLAIMRAGMARDGLARMAEDAALAYELEPGGSPRRAVCRLLEGVGRHLSGDFEAARSHLQEGMRGAAVEAPGIHALCLAQLAALALDERDAEGAAWFAGRAKAVVSASAGLAGAPTAALVFATSAAARAGRGQLAEASDDRRQALALLGDLSNFAAWYECEARIVLARACLRLSDAEAARELLAEASLLVRQVQDAPLLQRWLDELREQLTATDGAALPDAWSLTTAELRVVQFLPSHLSFPQIAERLYVSPNTVKTHVRAVYRKLDASSRGQAVELAQRNGLLDAGRV